jgi:hypothetical protein
MIDSADAARIAGGFVTSFGCCPKAEWLGLGTDRDQWHEWSPPKNIGGEQFSLYQHVAAVASSPSALDLFVIGKDGSLWTATWRAPDR